MSQSGIFDQFSDAMMSPLFLGGASLLSGGGMGGAIQGMQAGNQFAAQRQKMAEQQAKRQAFEGLFSDPSALAGVPMGVVNVARAAGPEAGLPILSQSFPKPKDPLDEAYKRAQINKLNEPQRMHVGSTVVEMGPGGPRQIYKADDPIEQYLLKMLQPQPAQQQPQPSQQTNPGPLLQPQSFDGGVMPGGVTLASDTADPNGPAPVPQRDDAIDTPYGKMPRDKARELGGTMLLSPKYHAAGKALLDAAQSGKMEGMGKPAVNALEEKTIGAASQLARIDGIMKQYNESFLKVPKRMQMLANSWTAKAGGKLAPDQERELASYAKFRASAVNNLNAILKEMSGSAVTPQEYERIKGDAPNAGTGLFDGDDPVSFKAKGDRSVSTLRAAIARYNFMRSKGLMFDKSNIDQFMALDDVPAAIDKRGAEIEADVRRSNPNADPMAIQKSVDQRLKREFGI